MAVKPRGELPNKRRKYDEAFRTEALSDGKPQHTGQQLGSSPKLLYRWQQAQAVAGSVEVARDPEVRALRAHLKRMEQELGI